MQRRVRSLDQIFSADNRPYDPCWEAKSYKSTPQFLMSGLNEIHVSHPFSRQTSSVAAYREHDG